MQVHGTDFKNIALLTEHTPNYIRILKKQVNQFRFVVGNSKADAIRKNGSFEVENAIVTGSPRNDVFFEGKDYFNILREKHNIKNYNRVILYAPTFRDSETIPPFSDNFWRRLNDSLIKNNEIFIVKKHPWDKFLKVPDTYSKIKD